MPKKVEYSRIEIVDNDFTTALTTHSDGIEYFLDRETGAVESIIDPDYVGEIPEAAAEAKKIRRQKRRYIPIESLFSSQCFEIMEDFAEGHTEGRVQESLFRALRGRKPFRSFKDALFEFPEVREAWFKFEQERLNEYALEWLKDEEIDAVLVTYQQRHNRPSQPEP